MGAFSGCSALHDVIFCGLSTPEYSDIPIRFQRESCCAFWIYDLKFCGYTVRKESESGSSSSSSSSNVASSRDSSPDSSSNGNSNGDANDVSDNWFINNVGWMAPSAALAVSLVGFVRKYDVYGKSSAWLEKGTRSSQK